MLTLMITELREPQITDLELAISEVPTSGLNPNVPWPVNQF